MNDELTREALTLRMTCGGLYTLEQVLRVLDIGSDATAQNWLCRGQFPGALLCSDGHWVFDGLEILRVKREMEELRRKNEEGRLDVPDLGDCTCYMGLSSLNSPCPVHEKLQPLPNDVGDETYWKHR